MGLGPDAAGVYERGHSAGDDEHPEPVSRRRGWLGDTDGHGDGHRYGDGHLYGDGDVYACAGCDRHPYFYACAGCDGDVYACAGCHRDVYACAGCDGHPYFYANRCGDRHTHVGATEYADTDGHGHGHGHRCRHSHSHADDRCRGFGIPFGRHG